MVMVKLCKKTHYAAIRLLDRSSCALRRWILSSLVSTREYLKHNKIKYNKTFYVAWRRETKWNFLFFRRRERACHHHTRAARSCFCLILERFVKRALVPLKVKLFQLYVANLLQSEILISGSDWIKFIALQFVDETTAYRK